MFTPRTVKCTVFYILLEQSLSYFTCDVQSERCGRLEDRTEIARASETESARFAFDVMEAGIKLNICQ